VNHGPNRRRCERSTGEKQLRLEAYRSLREVARALHSSIPLCHPAPDASPLVEAVKHDSFCRMCSFLQSCFRFQFASAEREARTTRRLSAFPDARRKQIALPLPWRSTLQRVSEWRDRILKHPVRCSVSHFPSPRCSDVGHHLV
jgi:hypothetical protein